MIADLKPQHRSVLIDISIEIFLLITAYVFIINFGCLHFEPFDSSTQIFVWSLVAFPFWALLLIQKGERWRRCFVWLSSLIFLFNPILAALIFAVRLINLSLSTRVLARVVFAGITVIGLFHYEFLMILVLLGPSGAIQTEELKVGESIVTQSIWERALSSHPTLVIEKRVYLLPKIYTVTCLDEIKDQWELIEIKSKDSSMIEYKKNGQIVQTKV